MPSSDPDSLQFITIEGLLRYGEAFVRIPRTSPDAISLPATPSARSDRAARAREAMVAIRAFADRAHEGFSSAADYRTARRSLLDDACGGDALVFFAAWNCLLAEGALAPLFAGAVGTVRKPARRRPVAIVPRAQLTLQLAEGRIVLDLGDDRFWLLPRESPTARCFSRCVTACRKSKARPIASDAAWPICWTLNGAA